MSVHTNTTQEVVMGKAIPSQHPAVVLRSHYTRMKALLATAMIAVVGLSASVVILSTDEDQRAGTTPATQVSPASDTRYDGGPEEGTRGLTPAQSPNIRSDGGPEEGTRGLTPAQSPDIRSDGGPEEGSRGPGR
jgi:hypothetical protein